MGVQLLYIATLFVRATAEDASPELPGTGVGDGEIAIVVCARNEAQNLRTNLPIVLQQEYVVAGGPRMMEVIVVNDESTDETEQVLGELQRVYSNLKIVQSKGGKKQAIRAALAYSKADKFVFTDADCRPASAEWAAAMAAPLNAGKQIVAGYGGYERTKGLLNAFIRWETLHTYLQYCGYARAGVPYMAVGRNMACTRAAAERAMASEIWNRLPYGDDDMLVAAVADKENMAVISAVGAHTVSVPKASFGEWVGQKQRHLSTGKHYRFMPKMLLGLYAMAHAASWLLFVWLLFSATWWWALVVFVVRSVVLYGVWWRVASRLQEKISVMLFPVFDLGWMMYNFAFFPFIAWINKRSWK